MTNNLFDALGLKKSVIKAIKNLGYSAPTPVQAEFIPVVLQGRDALASAKTGSGKTSAYTIPVLNFLLDYDSKTALFVAPTRELAQQIQSVFRDLAKDTDINTALITGGKNMQGQLRKLKSNPRVIIGTPGRLNDHLKRKSLKLDNTAIVVWDETDRMLDLGFAAQIEEIISFLPEQRQTLMLSATFPPRVLKLAEKYLNNPQKVIIGELNNPAENVTQKNIKIEGNDKLKKLTSLLKEAQGQILVFVQTQRAAAEITRYLKKKLFDAAALHGGLKQKDRDAAVKGFREHSFKILIATDVAARGLDIPAISTVINYEPPQVPEEYIHRLGRTGRYDRTGLCLNLIARADRAQWKQVRAFLDKKYTLSGNGETIPQNHSGDSENKSKVFPPHAPNPSREKQEEIASPKTEPEGKSKILKNPSSKVSRKTEKPAGRKLSLNKLEDKTSSPQKQEEYVFTPFKKVYVGKAKKEPCAPKNTNKKRNPPIRRHKKTADSF